MDRYYLVKYGTDVFPKDTMVKFETITNSGRCYLVSDLEDNLKREWIMDYNLYTYKENPSSIDEEYQGKFLKYYSLLNIE